MTFFRVLLLFCATLPLLSLYSDAVNHEMPMTPSQSLDADKLGTSPSCEKGVIEKVRKKRGVQQLGFFALLEINEHTPEKKKKVFVRVVHGRSWPSEGGCGYYLVIRVLMLHGREGGRIYAHLYVDSEKERRLGSWEYQPDKTSKV